MKKLITIQFLLLLSYSAIGKCLSESLTFWPNNKEININSVFVIDGYGRSQETVNELGKAHKVFLKSNKEEIELIVTEVNVGLYQLTQVVLRPKTKLTPNTEYKLVIKGVTSDKIKKYNTETHKHEDVIWTTTNEVDNQPPIWTSLPAEFDKSYVEYGCGPATYVDFKFRAKETSELLFKVTLKSQSDGTETDYYIQPQGNLIKIGHGMCLGAFNFNQGRNYSVAIDLMDSSGNITKWTDNSIAFTKP
jgi:hypothetical protein